jgi:hypothetical protein
MKKQIFFVVLIILPLVLCIPGFSLTMTGCLSGSCENGQGKAKFDRGSTYEGEWKNGNMNGWGIYTFEKGNMGQKYKGEFKNGQFEGEGTFWAVDGSRFEGTWVNGQQVKGTYYFNNRNELKCTGQWKGPYLNGEGACWYANGTKKEGLWQNGQYQGKK